MGEHSPLPAEEPARAPDSTPPQEWSGPLPPQQPSEGHHRGSPDYPVAASLSGPQPQPPSAGETADGEDAGRVRQPRQSPPPRPGADYVGSIPAEGLVPSRKVRPARGWRRVIYKATFGLVNTGRSPEEMRQAQLETAIRTPLRGRYKIGVLGKGGVGKTTVAACVGAILAHLRLEDRVVAIDADTSFGKLASRVDPDTPGSYWDLAADGHFDTFADLRTQVGNNADGLFVLRGGSATTERRVLDPAVYRRATARLDRHFTISIIDCGAVVDAPVTLEVLRDLDALIMVSSPWVDGASWAAQTMDWLAALGMGDLLHRTVVVLNDSDGHADTRTRSILAQRFASQGHVVIEVPFDAHLRPGGVIDVNNAMNPQTRQRFYEIAAAIAEQFTTTHRHREHRSP